MSLIDWIPVVSTIKHSFDNPQGMRISDYSCHMDGSVCTSGDPAAIAAAKIACERDIDNQLLAFIKDYCGGGILDAVMHDAVGDIVGLVVAYLVKKSIASASGLSMPIVGAVLVVDSFVDLAIVITTLNKMKDAANSAKLICCKCSEVSCSGTKQNTTLLKISRWYWGPERSFEQTVKEAQEEADKTYKCPGNCTTGGCKPKVYVINWSQGGFGMTRTAIQYDVYCECQ